MNAQRQRKLTLIGIIFLILSIASALILYALRQNISLFYSPNDVVLGSAPKHTLIRVGGMVVKGSVQRGQSLQVNFTITDYKQAMQIHYQGILPDLFREGQGIVAQGELNDQGDFDAVEILAKHDEKYMPPEVRSALSPQAGTP